MNVYVFTVDDGTNHFPYLIIVTDTQEHATEAAVNLAANVEGIKAVRLYGALEAPGVIITKGGAFVSEIYADE
jgi:6,7-dimethyl-8-ribityllumazine synthase